MVGAPRLSIVMPTMRRRAELAQALAALEDQTLPRSDYELILAEDALADAHGPHPEGTDVAIVRGAIPGASAARNAGWRAARAPVVLFVDDDIRAPRDLAARHLAAHARGANAVLGHVRWAPELKVTPFMHWVDRGVQFDWRTIAGEGPKWWHFYTANASASRALLEAVGGFDEVELPFLYEDLDLARRMSDHGLWMAYDAGAVADHLVPVTIESFEARLPRLAASELAFTRRWPEADAYFRDLFARFANAAPASGRGTRLIRFVPRRTPRIGHYLWHSADAYYCQRLGPVFLAEWERLQDRGDAGVVGGGGVAAGGLEAAGAQPLS
jgi:glycosyltransferase involved in cell wall biosynthesis